MGGWVGRRHTALKYSRLVWLMMLSPACPRAAGVSWPPTLPGRMPERWLALFKGWVGGWVGGWVDALSLSLFLSLGWVGWVGGCSLSL